MFEFTPYVIPLIISAGIMLAVGLYALRYRRHPAALSFAVAMLAAGVWAGSFVFEIAGVGLHTKIFWANVQFLGITLLPVAWLTLTLDYIGYTRHRRRILLVALIIPVITNILLWTNDLHHLWRGTSQLNTTAAPFTLVEYDYQFWFAIHAPYGYVLFLISLVAAGYALTGKTPRYRQQIKLLLLSTMLPLLVDALYLLGLSPIPQFNMTPLAFSVTGLLLAWNMFGFQFLDLMPIARDCVIESMNDIVIVLDTAHRIVDLNPAAEAIVGARPADVVGQSATEVFAVQPDLLQRYLDAAETHDEIVVGTGAARRTFDLRISTLYRRQHRPMGRLIVLRDITARKRAEEERERLIVELDAYAHTVAHDLKNPLAVFVGFTEVLQESAHTVLNAEQRHHLDIMARTSHKMVTIVNELLLFASVREQQQVDIVPLDMGAIVRVMQERFTLLIAEHEAQITLPERWPTALGYAPWIEEVWANYLSNAIKYGGTPPQITLGATPQTGGMIRFWITDNGDGLTPAQQQAIFHEFARVKYNRTEGQGLGLSIVQRIITRLGGQVGVDSTRGQGSTFTFTLPAALSLTPDSD
ncbi:MAG: PAS domain S-box protein [Anaerolineae bacterium]|nr:PAS domain S-box protein [Anaerolineae bacterium]